MSKRDPGAVEIILDIAMESPLASLGIAAALAGVAASVGAGSSRFHRR